MPGTRLPAQEEEMSRKLTGLFILVALVSVGCSDDTTNKDAAPPAQDSALAEAGSDKGALEAGADANPSELGVDKGGDQAPQPDSGGPSTWAVAAGGNKDDSGYEIAQDSAGNIYLTGVFTGTANFGSDTLTSKGKDDIFVAKLNKSGKFLWAVAAGGSGGDVGADILVDSSGIITVTGFFQATASFGSLSLTAKGSNDVFVAQLNNSGKFLWVSQAGAKNGSTLGLCLAMDGAGNSALTGYFSGTAKFGATTLTAKGNNDAFVARLDNTGKFLWATSAGGTDYAHGAAVAIDGAGHIYITGDFSGKTNFGTKSLTAQGGSDAFIAKLDTNGTFLWAAQMGSADTLGDKGMSIAVDGAGNSMITGTFSGTASFGKSSLTAKGGKDVFVAQMDKNCNLLWAVAAGGTDTDSSNSLVMDNAGNGYLTGRFKGTMRFEAISRTSKGDYDIFVTKVDKTGKFLWATSTGDSQVDTGYDLAVDSAGACTLTGFISGTVSFGTTLLTAKGGRDVFVARLDSSGKF